MIEDPELINLAWEGYLKFRQIRKMARNTNNLRLFKKFLGLPEDFDWNLSNTGKLPKPEKEIITQRLNLLMSPHAETLVAAYYAKHGGPDG